MVSSTQEGESQLSSQYQLNITLQYNYPEMTHRRYLPLPATNQRQENQERPPLRNNEARLKSIYQHQMIFKQKNKEPLRKSLPKPAPKRSQQPNDLKFKSQVQPLNLAEIKASQRYKEHEKQYSKEQRLLNLSHQQTKYRVSKQQGVYTSRNKDEINTDRSDMFKIRRKSISGSLKKKIKEQNAQYLSANPVSPSELNYYEEGRKLYKEGKISEALKLFELTIEKQPDLPDAHYYTALCLLSRQHYHKAYSHLSLLLQKFINYNKKTVFIFSAIAAKHIEKVDKAIAILAQGIEKYPDYLDLYIYRAKLLQQQQKYEIALKDYEIIMKSKKDHSEVLLNYAICLKSMGKQSNCVSILTSALYNDQEGLFKAKILLERMKLYFSENKYKECKKDLSKLQEIDGQNCQLYYYKGLIQLAEQNKKAALLSFQRCIRSNQDSDIVAKSLVQIVKSKVEDRDFYSAYYHACRANYLKVHSEDIIKFTLFTEGVVFLMKRKIKEGVDNLNRLQSQHTLGPYFDKLFYLYRAFGHFMQNEHQAAINDYLMAEKYTPKDKHITYNQLIAEGIVKVHQGQFENALEKFDQAQNVISVGNSSLKIEPFIYRAMSFVEKIKYKIVQQKSDDLQTLEEIFIALKQLDKAYDVNDSNSNMLYLRSLIYMYLGKIEDGLQDIIKAISKSEENVAKYFFYRALAHETLGNTKQALNDFNICINLDPNQTKGYLERAKLFFGNQQPSKGIEDLNKFSSLEPTADSKLHECCLYYLAKDYDQAQSCLQQIKDSQKKKELQLFLLFKQLRIMEVKKLMPTKTDAMICQVMLGQWQSQDGDIDELAFFNKTEYYCYLGIKRFNLGLFEEAINNFTMAIKQKTLMDLQQNNQNSTQESAENEDTSGTPIDAQTKQNELHYLNYNLFVTYLANGDPKSAYEIFVRDLLSAKEQFLRSEIIGTFSKLLFETLKGGQSQSEGQKQVLQIQLFKSMLGQSSDQIDIELSNFILRTKLCYLMPYAKKIYEQYEAKIHPAYMLDCLKISEVENRPEPPWVKRTNQNLIFTDEVININVEFQTTEHDEESEEQQSYSEEEEEEAEEGEEDGGEDQTQREETPFDPRRFRQQMRLDDDIERKLKKIMAGKKEEDE